MERACLMILAMLELDFAGLSDKGPIRPNNEDFVAQSVFAEAHKGAMFVIADGVGGSRAGEVASREATTRLLEAYVESPKNPGRALKNAFQLANSHICDLSHSEREYSRMETTLSALVLADGQSHIGHVGDTRLYLVRNSDVKLLTNDHSEVADLQRMGLISAEEARHHPRRNIITRSVGSSLFINADFSSARIEEGDVFVLCTDGLWEPLDDYIIARVALDLVSLEACRTLVDLAIAGGATDNVSVQVIKVLKVDHSLTAAAARGRTLLQKAIGLFSNERAVKEEN